MYIHSAPLRPSFKFLRMREPEAPRLFARFPEFPVSAPPPHDNRTRMRIPNQQSTQQKVPQQNYLFFYNDDG